ncbi:CMRF35-like molecule 5 isoform X2 [Eptesicus fuscus]|uniref:CMRF35-like molecule 5 isoform X2 n=1 Tax=Eptesicus fuscus TaxID=29078 RepID=UPI002403A2C5|nr:CMRF35-like molecule 5 isoform X2 [Eptesicus fuscus]
MAWEATHLLPLVLLVLLASVTSPRPQGQPGNPRYVITDNPRWGYFTVTMTALREDSGLYWCGTLESSGIAILRTIRLVVSPAATLTTTRTTSTTSPTRSTTGTFATSSVIDSSPDHWTVILSAMVVLPLLLALALLVILYFVIKARQRRRRAGAGEGKAHHIHDISTHEDETVHRTDPPARQRNSQLSWGSDQQIGSGKDTGDIHYASFTHLEPFGLENPIYINTRPGPKPTPDPFLDVEYASITKN